MPSPDYRLPAIELVRFDPRVEAGICTSQHMKNYSRLLAAYGQHMENLHRDTAVDQIDHFLQDFLSTCPDYYSWFEEILCADGGPAIKFSSGQPWICDSWQAWRKVTDKIDPDALICFAYVHGFGREPQAGELLNWGLLPMPGGKEVDHLLNRRHLRVVDVHTHLEGCEFAPYIWRQVCEGRIRRRNLYDYSDTALNSGLLGVDSTLPMPREIEAVYRALEAWIHLRAAFAGPEFGSRNDEDFPSDAARALWPERAILCRAWLAASSRNPWQRRVDAMRRLSTYLHGKHLFFQRFVQTPGGNPGLTRFRRYFDRLKTAGRAPDQTIPRQMPRWCRLTRTALDSPSLDGIEIRIAPFDRSVGQYRQFFRLWRAAEEQGKLYPARRTSVLHRRRARDFPPTSFVIHFTRWRPQRYVTARHHDQRGHIHLETQKLLEQLDRQTAILQRFRADHAHEAAAIVGVDVANLERHNGIELFAPYLAMLCGRFGERDREQLCQHAGLSAYARHWHTLIAQEKWPGPVWLPPLGLTYHAGEDYFHPADGLYAIDSLLTLCRTREGDRIGHGLALGAKLDPPTGGTDGRITMTAGVAFETLVWLRDRFEQMPNVDCGAARKLDREIDRLSIELLGATAPPMVMDYLRRAQKTFRFTRPFPIDVSSPAERDFRKFYEAFYAELTAPLRHTYIRMPDCLADPEVVAGIDRVRHALIDEIVHRRMFLEINPTSNLAVGNITEYHQHPIFRIFRCNDQIRVTINCDDPGTFSTRLESEFAAIQEAADFLSRDDRDGFQRIVERAAELSELAAFAERKRLDDPALGGQ